MILGISGRKQAGKNTTANILHGIILKEYGFVNDWSISGDGHLMVDDGSGWGEFWIERKDEDFVTWADNNMWPFVNSIALPTTSKRFALNYLIFHQSAYMEQTSRRIKFKIICFGRTSQQIKQAK